MAAVSKTNVLPKIGANAWHAAPPPTTSKRPRGSATHAACTGNGTSPGDALAANIPETVLSQTSTGQGSAKPGARPAGGAPRRKSAAEPYSSPPSGRSPRPAAPTRGSAASAPSAGGCAASAAWMTMTGSSAAARSVTPPKMITSPSSLVAAQCAYRRSAAVAGQLLHSICAASRRYVLVEPTPPKTTRPPSTETAACAKTCGAPAAATQLHRARVSPSSSSACTPRNV
mmetsp:Transcript_31202/g.109792  ORF Transcript_31202/g.109792 Transcript_31202/m.109792 type:complete len:229 (-) Transcript_31202:491-1177(-)